jgi:hypothetical protein
MHYILTKIRINILFYKKKQLFDVILLHFADDAWVYIIDLYVFLINRSLLLYLHLRLIFK